MSKNKFPPKPKYDPDTGPVYLYGIHTVRAALDECSDFGRPRRILLCVLIDRGGRELPIQADIVGRKVTASPGDRVDVLVSELDGRDAVELVRA